MFLMFVCKQNCTRCTITSSGAYPNSGGPQLAVGAILYNGITHGWPDHHITLSPLTHIYHSYQGRLGRPNGCVFINKALCPNGIWPNGSWAKDRLPLSLYIMHDRL